MDAEARDKFWNRSRPVLGFISGLFTAVYFHLVGVPDDAGWHDALTTLFETSPLVGYVLFVGGGTGFALVFRLFEDRYIYD